MRLSRLCLSVLPVLGILLSPVCAQQRDEPELVSVRILTNHFVLPEKFRKLKPLAEEAGIRLDAVNVEASASSPSSWLEGTDLVILDVPRPNDRATVEQALGDALTSSALPSITIGGGKPSWRSTAPHVASRLVSYYTAGGDRNFRLFFEAVRRWKQGADMSALPEAIRLPETGYYHPDAPQVFDSLKAYLAWGAPRWQNPTGRVGFVAHSSVVSTLRTELLDALIARTEAEGLVPVVFWFDDTDPKGLTKVAGPGKLDVIVNISHMRNGKARSAEFRHLDIPVIQTVGFREGGVREWTKSTSGIPARTAAIFLAGPEGWGMSDPMVISAIEDGALVALPAQIDALCAKLTKLVALRRKPAAAKHVALMFWNHPFGEKNLGASNLNVPTSIETISSRLAEAGYDVPFLSEPGMIEAGQKMLGGLYRTEPLEDLLEKDLAVALPVADYERWLSTLSPGKRHAYSHNGAPAKHWAVRDVDGIPSFIIPRLKRGNLVVMPQMPRGTGPSSAHYHDTAASPDHLYMAAYLYLREQFGADAIIHLGTHGTQEWLAGKDRGLAADDDPFLAVGPVPVFYPYIQDNIGEALQAKRRGRAVTISHQTPTFAPSGLYDELRDIHGLIHDHMQLDEGAVRDKTAADIVDTAAKADLTTDLDWSEEDARAHFDAFLLDLHDHLHELARTAMPLGLHTFGRAADPDQRLVTVMQQLGKPLYDAVGLDPEEVFASDFSEIRTAEPYVTLHRYLREGGDRSGLSAPLQKLMARADELDAALAAPEEIEGLLAGLSGRFVPPGTGGDPIRNPDIRSGRNLYAFEPDRIPTPAAFEAGGEAFAQLVSAFAADNDGAFPQKLAFSLWSSEAIRHFGVTESQILHALGLKPVRDRGGRVTALEIIPATELKRPRIDVVIQVTSIYRDQFDGFMRLLADAIDRVSKLDEETNPLAVNSARIAAALRDKGLSADEADEQSRLRIFSNAPGSYGSGLPHRTMASTTWDDDGALAESFLKTIGFAYGARTWGKKLPTADLFAEQLKGTQAAIMARSSNVHGVLSTDHPFEYLGGLSLAVRHLDGTAPSLFISDLRESRPKTASLSRFLANELRVRALNPHWIEGMKAEGYAGTLEMLDTANNLFGWQVVDPSTVRADQWQAMFDTYIADTHDLGMDAYFEAHNPSAQAQIMERMVEAIRKGYWDAPEDTRAELVRRWRELAADAGVSVGEKPTKDFLETMARGYGLASASMPNEAQDAGPDAARAEAAPDTATSSPNQPQQVTGQVLEQVQPEQSSDPAWSFWAALAGMLGLTLLGAVLQLRFNASRAPSLPDRPNPVSPVDGVS